MRPDLIHTTCLALVAASLLGCSSTSSGEQKGSEVEQLGPTETVPWDPAIMEDDRKVGFILAEIDRKMRIWNSVVLEGREAKDASRLDLIESSLRYEASKHTATLIGQLEVGAPSNRQIAAAALGFSESPEVLGPLIAALDDPSDQVVANALLGLSTLHDPATPTAPIANKLADISQPIAVRSNACRALRSLDLSSLEAGERDRVIDAARGALGDEESALRVQGALIIAQVGDVDSIDRVARHLADESTLVARAASRSLARLGSVDHSQQGRVVRALTAAFTGVDDKQVRLAILHDLQVLTKRNYGEDDDAWIEFAQKLP